jgi:transposase
MDMALAIKENTELKKENERLSAKIRRLEEELALALFRRFGKSSERLEGQSDLPFDHECGESESPESTNDEKETITYTRGKRGRKKLSEALPREHYYHELDEVERTCACGHELKRIGEDVSERLNVIPAKLWVEVHHHAKYACPHCQGINESEEPAVKKAGGAPALIPGSIVTPGLAAFVWTNKFCDHLPFYRQEASFERIGALVSRQDMSNWTIALAAELEPLITLIEDDIRAGPVIQMDETPVKVLKLDATGKDGLGYMWLALGGEGRRSVRYRFAPGRGSIHAASFLGDYAGYLQSDGYKAYDALAAGAKWTHVGCWAHARRAFFEAEKVAHSPLLTDALGRIKKLYALEHQAREKGLEAADFLAYRRGQIAPFLGELKEWAAKTQAQVLPSGKTGASFAYLLGQWDKLERFLEHELLTPDNNAAENAIRPFVVGRNYAQCFVMRSMRINYETSLLGYPCPVIVLRSAVPMLHSA